MWAVYPLFARLIRRRIANNILPQTYLTRVQAVLLRLNPLHDYGISQLFFSFMRIVWHLLFEIHTVWKLTNAIWSLAVLCSFWLPDSYTFGSDGGSCEIFSARIVAHDQIFATFVGLLRFSQRLSRLLVVWKILIQSRIVLGSRADWVALRMICLDRFPLGVILWRGEIGPMRWSLLARHIKRYSKLLLPLLLLFYLRLRPLGFGVEFLAFPFCIYLNGLILLLFMDHPGFPNKLGDAVIQPICSLWKIWLHMLAFFHLL